MSRQIVITHEPGGDKVEAQGFHGKGCETKVRNLIDARKSAEIRGEPEYEPEYFAKESEEEIETE